MIHDSRHSNCDAYACRCPEGPRESTTDIGRCGRCGGDAAFIQPWDGPRYVSASEAASLNTSASRSPAPEVVEALPIAAIHSSIKWVEETVAPRRCDNEAVSDCSRCNLVFLARMMTKALAALPAQQEPARAADAENDYWESRIWTDHADAGADR